MKARLVIRKMSVRDVPAVAGLEKELFHAPWPEKAFEYEITQNPVSHHLVAEHEGKVIGYIVAWLVVDEVQIATIGVDPGWQGKGIGKLLMIAAMRWAFEKGASVATLEVRQSNEPAIKLYERLGFEVVGRRENYYKATGEDALLMTNSNPDMKKLDEIWSEAAKGFELETETGNSTKEGGTGWENSTN